jgi:hypothetical protein
MFNMTNTNNDAQIRYWKSGPGSNWAGYQQGLDAEAIQARVVDEFKPFVIGDRIEIPARIVVARASF